MTFINIDIDNKHRGDSLRSRYALVCYFTNPYFRGKEGYRPVYNNSYSKTFYSKHIGPEWNEPYPNTAKSRFERMIYKYHADGNLLHARLYLNLNKANAVNNYLALLTPLLEKYKENRRNVYKSLSPLHEPVENLLVWKFDPMRGGLKDEMKGKDEQIILHPFALSSLQACDIYYHYLVSEVKIPQNQARSLTKYLGRLIIPESLLK